MKPFFTSSILLFCLVLASAQPGKGKLKLSEYIEKSNQLILQSSYEEAAKYLEKVVANEPQNTRLLYQLADAYRLARNSEQAARYYGRALKFSDNSAYLNYPMILFHYGNSVMKNGDYEEATKLFGQFQRNYKGNERSRYKNWAGVLIRSCDWASDNPFSKENVKVSGLDESVNSGKTEYSPILVQEGVLLFSSLRNDQVGTDIGRGMRSSIYTSQYSGEKWLKPVPFSGPFRYLEDHVGHGSFSPDKERFYFTICPSVANNDPECSIYYSQIEGNSWGDPESISTINIVGYKSSTPFATVDDLGTERIYFSSNRPNGEGGMDIWYVIRDAAGNFTTAKNLGEKINTPYNEVTPFYNEQSGNFYFSSDGYLGFGGFDILRVSFDGKGFGETRNLGKPFNSSQDDMYYAENIGRSGGFLVSNREYFSKGVSSTCCDNIFEFRILGSVSKSNEIVFEGRAFGIDGQQTFELDDVHVQWYEVTRKGTKSWVDENYAFSNKPFRFLAQKGKSYEVHLAKPGYEEETFNYYQSHDFSPDSVYKKDFFLRSEGTLIRGIVYGDDGKRRQLLPNVEMKVYRIGQNEEQLDFVKSLMFEEEGFKTTLRAGANYRLIFTKSEFLVGSLNISSKELVDSGTPEFHVTLLKEQVGLSIVIPDVNFQSGNINLDSVSLFKLDGTAAFLRDNPGVEVEIGAFTDNVGPASVNKDLSVKRANAVIAYLMGKGVSPERLVAKGYGETKPLAENDSGINRLRNQRIEMKILKINR